VEGLEGSRSWSTSK